MRLQQYINEIFDTKVKIRKTESEKGSYYTYEFKIGKNIYDVNIGYNGEDVWEIDFELTTDDSGDYLGDIGITGKGHAFEVFSGVIKCIEDFIKTEKPTDDIEIEAKTDDPSRLKLYDKLIKTKVKKFGYKFTYKKKSPEFITYRFSRIKK